MNEANIQSAPWLLVVDLEATCDDRGAVPKHEMEIIEIGAVMVNGKTLRAEEEFQSFVKPRRHPRLTPFCTQLTTIRQADVDGAPTFPEAMNALGRFLGGRRALFCSWGDYDKNQFAQDARHHRVRLPFGSDHANLKKLFSSRLGVTRRFGMSAALREAGLPLEGTHHRGIDDARNIARLLPIILARGRSPQGT